jgi:hypothetical protein
MRARESQAQAKVRWGKLELLQAHYNTFAPFLEDVMTELGFTTTEIQLDIGAWMEHGPQYIMVQAQRGQAKTTIAAAFAVWCLIHSPAHRVLIISAGGTQAVEISTLIVRIIETIDVLDCMRPDKLAGDRTSVEAYDVHHSLKGLDKSPSVACVGIDSNLQGKRADLLIPDDIESSKNSATPVQRAKLLHLTKDFTSINSTGRIIWLGTPQTMESIYNSLPARGVHIRIWPGRYPTQKQEQHYKGHMAPLLHRRLALNPGLAQGGGLLGDQGQPIDSVLLNEEQLQKKEQDQGTPYFQLQHMLNTEMSDALRFPLKTTLLTVMRFAGTRFPLALTRGMLSTQLRDFAVADHAFQMMAPHEVSPEVGKLQSIWAYIDPAAGGANGDETAYAIGGFLSGNIYLLAAGGLPGGYTEEKLRALADVIALYKPEGVTIEKNMGYGAFAAVFTPILRKVHQCQIDEDLVHGQKEARIINTLAPVMGRGALIVDESVIDQDSATLERYSPSERQSYSLFYQLQKMTAVRNALVHDDRIDALEGLVRHFAANIAQDQQKQVDRARERAHAEMLKDPLKHNRTNRYGPQAQQNATMLRHRRR